MAFRSCLQLDAPSKPHYPGYVMAEGQQWESAIWRFFQQPNFIIPILDAKKDHVP
jgi:hypothetical protein